jgi:hypothetical protein
MSGRDANEQYERVCRELAEARQRAERYEGLIQAGKEYRRYRQPWREDGHPRPWPLNAAGNAEAAMWAALEAALADLQAEAGGEGSRGAEG